MSRVESEPLQPYLSALSHPVRAQVLTILTDRNASAADIAEAIEEPASKVRYHLRALAKLGLVEWDEAVARRGVREYRWISATRQVVDEAQYAQMSPAEIRTVSLYCLRLIFGDAAGGLRDGTFSRRRDHVLTRFRREVDEKGWIELVEVFRTALTGVEEVSERAAERIAKSGEEPLTISASLLLFDLLAPARAIPAVLPGQDET